MNNSLKGEQYYHWGIGIDQHIGVGNQYKLEKDYKMIKEKVANTGGVYRFGGD
ncbi:MAG: hypothetical protein PUB24_02060 [Lachnospiraceae bacterium]|jgi:hypothetical protein|nr:hypothetical protein [Lachnospiraceae bacterium]